MLICAVSLFNDFKLSSGLAMFSSLDMSKCGYTKGRASNLDLDEVGFMAQARMVNHHPNNLNKRQSNRYYSNINSYSQCIRKFQSGRFRSPFDSCNTCVCLYSGRLNCTNNSCKPPSKYQQCVSRYGTRTFASPFDSYTDRAASRVHLIDVTRVPVRKPEGLAVL
ncbi:hypothetical protein BB560_003486 [Smittium megazygosporum]|uniref:Pacifastin domain-containing protein n=1 Tax=Smittium megazygosporum TaxID=133381 RepID=A0A2T9ZBU9_9FUNG|nr:hypothetical protein BB560_003486 [Smittium megazygosporum]